MNIVTTPSRVLAEEFKKVKSARFLWQHTSPSRTTYSSSICQTEWFLSIFIALFKSDAYNLWVIQNAITNKRFVLEKGSLILTLLSVQTMLVTLQQRMCHILVIYVSNGPLSHVLGIMRVLFLFLSSFSCPSKLYKQQHWHWLHYLSDGALNKVFQASNKQSIIPVSKCWVFGVVLEGCSLSLFFCTTNMMSPKYQYTTRSFDNNGLPEK